MDYKIIICSHERSEQIQQKTLHVLSDYKIPKEKIYIFVAADEVNTYQTALPDYQIRVGALGLAENRNAATAFFSSDDYLFYLDDDIRGFKISSGSKLLPLDDLDKFIRQGFQECQSRGISMWGLYPVANAKWLKDTLSVGLVFCYGCAYGVINKKDILIDNSFKEDYERTLKYYLRDGKVLRCNWVAPVQSYCKGSGGLNQIRTLDKEKTACQTLVEKYPTLCKLKRSSKSDKIDIVFPRQLSCSQAFITSHD